MTAPDLLGRPEARLLARLARHVAPDLRVAASPRDWILARSCGQGHLQQRLLRARRPAALRRALAQAPWRRFGRMPVPTDDNPAPLPTWRLGATQQPPDDARLQHARIRAVAARALCALKGLPAPVALLDARGAWLIDFETGAATAIGTPPVGMARWRFGPPLVAPEVADEMRLLHDALLEGSLDVPERGALETAHGRMRLGIGQETAEVLRLLLPTSDVGLRIHRRPGLILLVRLVDGRPAYSLAIAAPP